LQVSFGEDSTELARRVERDWRAWCEAADLADKLRVKHESKVRDGECFATLNRNAGLDHPVQLDVRLVECDRVETPWELRDRADVVDGIEFDAAGNPVAYYVSRTHPGDRLTFGAGFITDYQRVLARDVLHWFRADRPGQARGVSELAPALNLFGQLRRYTLATVTAAEFAATVAGVMETDLPPPDDGSAITVSEATEVPMAPGSLLTLASGWKANFSKGEQPNATYGDFKGEILAEAGRSAGAPRDIVTADASNFNFASVRIGQLPYQRGVWIERRRDRRQLDKLFRAWWSEYTLIPEAEGGPPPGLPPLADAAWDWHWDGFAWMDPAKDAAAVESRLAMNLTTLSEECAAEGKDWEEVLEQRYREKAREKELAAKYGVEVGPPGMAPEPAMDDEFEEVAGG
jgi:lambda family phage portal protein